MSPASWTVLLLSDQHDDVRDLLPAFPIAPWRTLSAPLKTTTTAELTPMHPDILFIDATADVRRGRGRHAPALHSRGRSAFLRSSSSSTREASARFRFEVGADDFLLVGASAGEISARLELIVRRVGPRRRGHRLEGRRPDRQPRELSGLRARRPLDLTYKEFELLKFLAQRPGRVCDRDLLVARGVGLRLLRRHPNGRRPHPTPARQARARARGPDRNDPQRRLSAGAQTPRQKLIFRVDAHRHFRCVRLLRVAVARVDPGRVPAIRCARDLGMVALAQTQVDHRPRSTGRQDGESHYQPSPRGPGKDGGSNVEGRIDGRNVCCRRRGRGRWLGGSHAARETPGLIS